jgi:hypothetical protein
MFFFSFLDEVVFTMTSTLYYQLPLLSPGWQVVWDPATGKFYYYNTNTGVV